MPGMQRQMKSKENEKDEIHFDDALPKDGL